MPVTYFVFTYMYVKVCTADVQCTGGYIQFNKWTDTMDLIKVGVSVTCSRKKESSESGRTGCRAAARPVYNSTARLG